MIIGIDVGGTFTDAVLVDKKGNVVTARKKITGKTFDPLIDELMAPEVTSIHIGTTLALNALLEKKGLAPVGLLRLAGHAPDFVPRGFASFIETIGGGYECDGRPISPFCEQEAKAGIERLITAGAERLAVVGTFSSLYPDQELAVAALSPLPITLSHQLGGIGILERENAAVMNAALQPLFEKSFSKAKGVPLFFTQNNGSLLSLERALQFPILTLAAGPANSFMGAGRLSGCSEAVIVDIGGTSTDIGFIENAAVRRSYRLSTIGDVPLSLPMPDLLSLAIGGGSYLHNGEIGPESAGSALFQEAYAFGGSKLTLTDAALVLGTLTIDGADPKKVPLSKAEAYAYLKLAAQTILARIGSKRPLFIVGGGALLFPEELFGVPRLPMASLANAYGAALAERGVTIDRIAPLDELEQIKKEAYALAIAHGAHPEKVRIIQADITPLAYDSLKRARMVITVLG